MSGFAGYQNEIYMAGLGDVRPDLPTDLTRLEALAEERMPPSSFAYVAGAAGSESTARANRAAFEAWRLVPRMLRDVSSLDTSVTVLGTPMPAPVVLAPVGVLSIVHPDGESAVARAAASVGLPLVVSTAAATTLEDVAQASGDGPRWYQLYWPKDRELAVSFLERAAAAGYRALVVTLDTYTMGWRPRDLDGAFLPFLKGVGNQNYFADPVFQRTLGGVADEERLGPAVLQWAATFGDPTLTWDDLAFLREHWHGPIALKGIQHPDDARRAADAGIDGGDRVEPRRPPGRRRDRVARRAPRGGRGGRRSGRGPVRQRHPHGRRRRQGAGARRAGGAPRAPVRLRPRPRRRGRRAPRPPLRARRARADDGAHRRGGGQASSARELLVRV